MRMLEYYRSQATTTHPTFWGELTSTLTMFLYPSSYIYRTLDELQ